MTNLKSIVCITPIKHLDGVYEALSQYGDILYCPNISKTQLAELLANNPSEFIFTNPNKQAYVLGKDILENSNIKLINTCSTGTNHIDTNYCDEKGIKIWSLTKDYDLINELPSTAELSFGLMCALVRNINTSYEDVKNGNWDYEPFIGRQLMGLTVGIIGYGRLGKFMKKFCEAFGMNVKIYDPVLGYNDLDYLLDASDVVSLHVHVNSETRNMVDSNFLAKMRRGSYLVNTSRGELVDEAAIISYIKSGHIAGYGTDVIKDEFTQNRQSDLVNFARADHRVIITPHIGGMTWEGQTTAYKWAVNKFKFEV